MTIPSQSFWDPATNEGTAALDPEAAADLAVADPEVDALTVAAEDALVVDAAFVVLAATVAAALPPMGAVD